MSTRNYDNRGEQALGLFLDKYFYPALIRDGHIERIRMISEKNGLFSVQNA